jgi:hypothetical protein
MLQLEFDVKSVGKSIRVVVVDTRKQLHTVVQGIAWTTGDKRMYEPSKDLAGVTMEVFGQIVLGFSKQDLTWDVLVHECAHVAQWISTDSEDQAEHTGQLATLIAKDLKSNGYKIIL